MTLPTTADFNNAKRDLDDLAEIVTSPTVKDVPKRLGGNTPTLAKVMKRLSDHAPVRNRGAWVTDTTYEVNDIWQAASDVWYVVVTEYVSGETDVADIASGAVFVHQVNVEPVPVVTIEDLRSKIPELPHQHVKCLEHPLSSIGGGLFVYDPNDSSSNDDGLIIVVTVEGHRWRLVESARLNWKSTSGDHAGIVVLDDTSTGWVSSGADVYETAAAIPLTVDTVNASGMVLNHYNKKINIADFERAGDWAQAADGRVSILWNYNISLVKVIFSSVDGNAYLNRDSYAEFSGIDSEGGMDGFVTDAPAKYISCTARGTGKNGFHVKNGGNGTVIQNCTSLNCGTTDAGETAFNVGHGLIARDGCRVINHLSDTSAEDSYQIGDGGSSMSGDVELINCVGVNAAEDNIDVKGTADRLVIRKFRGKGAQDTAFNWHPNKDIGVTELTDSRFSGARQMCRLHAQRGAVLLSSRNVWNARKTAHNCAPALSLLQTTAAGAYHFFEADVFIAGGTSGAYKTVTLHSADNAMTMHNCTIHSPGEVGVVGVGAVYHRGAGLWTIRNSLITKNDADSPLITVEGTSPLAISSSVLWALGVLDSTVVIVVDGVSYTKSDIEGASFGGAGNLSLTNVQLNNIIFSDPNYLDDANDKLYPVWLNGPLAQHGRREWCPVKDNEGFPMAYWSWLGGTPTGRGGSCWVGAYSQQSGQSDTVSGSGYR